MANYLVKKGAEYLADKAGLKIPEPIKAALDPVGYAVSALAPKLNEAAGAAPGTAEAVADPKGFAKNLAKEVVKDYLTERNEIPEEDRSFKSSDAKAELDSYANSDLNAFKRGGKVKSTAKSKVNSASRRGDGIAQRGKTKGRYL